MVDDELEYQSSINHYYQSIAELILGAPISILFFP